MGRVVFTLLQVECDSADEALLRELLTRHGSAAMVLPSARTEAAPAPEASPARSIASHLLEGSLQELVMEAVQEQPGITVPDLASAVLNDTTPSARTRIGMALAPLVTIGRLLRSKATGKLYTPAAAVSLPEFQPPAPAVAVKKCPEFPPCLGCRTSGACVGIVNVDKPARREEPPKAASAVAAPAAPSAAHEQLESQILDLVRRQPGIRTGQIADELLNDSSQSARIRLGRVLTPMTIDGRIVRRGQDVHYLQGAAPPLQRPGRKPRFVDSLLEEAQASRRLDGETRVLEPEPPQEGAPLRVTVARGERGPVGDPGGRVAGVSAPAVVPGSLTEQIIKAVAARPGISRDELTLALLGNTEAANVRRLDMLLGTLVMSGQLARYNGRVFQNMAQAAKLKLPPPKRASDRGWPGAGAAPLAQVQTTKDIFDRIVAAFTDDHAAPIPDVAREIFGESTGRSVDKLQLFLRQLCATKRLMKLPGGGYRPVDEEERAVESETDDDEDSDELDEDEEQELVSNGQPDDEEPQELDVG